MILSMIVAHDNNRCIGVKNTLPWSLPKDLKRFKKLTMGKPIIMGRKTYESIGRPLPGRLNIVISRDNSFGSGICEQENGETRLKIFSSIHEVMDYLRTLDSEEIFVIGGSQIYSQFVEMDIVDKFYITQLNGEVPAGDAFFPKIDYKSLGYQEDFREDHDADYENQYNYSFINYVR